MANPVFGEGRLQVYTGNGKGKTTAAFGLAFRASGHGLKTVIIQFMKGDPEYGEVAAVGKANLNIELHQTGRPDFVFRDKVRDTDIDQARAGLRLAFEIVENGSADLLILDEANVAVDFGLLELDEVIKLIEARPKGMEMVLTGRGAHEKIIERADLVTEMTPVKHYFDQGLMGRKGIEF